MSNFISVNSLPFAALKPIGLLLRQKTIKTQTQFVFRQPGADVGVPYESADTRHPGTQVSTKFWIPDIQGTPKVDRDV